MAKLSTETKRPKRNRVFEQIHRNAAGIDAGARHHFAAVPEGRDTQAVQSFGTITSELYRLADWLAKCRIDTVAIEATGVYCDPLMTILEARGIEVVLVKPSALKSVNDRRKTDMLDCQWLQTLHTFGLLRGSFRPSEPARALRSCVRHRRTLIEDAATQVNRMQKALTQMNLRLDQAVTDITGETGMRIIRAIIGGERDPEVLAAMRDRRCAKTEQQIAEALRGHYSDEHLLVLAQAVRLWDVHRELIRECDLKIEQHLGTSTAKAAAGTLPPPRRREQVRKSVFPFDARALFHRMLGVDLTQIDGISTSTIATVVSEIGTDVDAWPTEKHFSSWLRLCPGSNISGGRRLSAHNRATTNRAATALRLAAQSLDRSKSALGAFYRRLKARLGPQKAINATAHKLARMIYRSLKYRTLYIDPGVDYYNTRFRDRTIQLLDKRARTLGYLLVPASGT